MAILPDELWRRIMEIGVEKNIVDYRSLCCLCIVSRRFRSLSDDDSLWMSLLLSDFPSSSSDRTSIGDTTRTSDSNAHGKIKNVYKIRYEKDRGQKRLIRRRAVLRIESEIAEHLRKIQELEHQSSGEKQKMNNAASELRSLRKIRQASVALNVWQPEIIRDRQKRMVEQSNVPVESRVNALEMELKLCKQLISGLDRSLQAERRRLQVMQDQLASVMYHPLQDFGYSNAEQIKSNTRTTSKKLKATTKVNQ
ncbi:f-box family protein [Genlisea aurea]|uniref:F-box family protein n=1 Tax=Genlisea aurea TaxID=192259 RepID=S8ECA5_9LAMI|nr:f-box family protein [Genlisea aurea]